MRGWGRQALVVLLIIYVILAVSYSLANPLYESTDEIRHFRYVRHLITRRSLPVQQPGAPRAQSHHPPLYYVLGALTSWWVPVAQDVYYTPPENPFWGYRAWEVGNDNKNQYLLTVDESFPFHGLTLAVYTVRWMTVLLGVCTVWMTYRIGCEVFGNSPGQEALALGAAALVAFNPQFLYLSGAVNNDIAAAMCGAALLWACVRLVQVGPSMRTDLTLGILFGSALLTKFSLIALLPPIGLAYLIAARPIRHVESKAHWNLHALVRGTLVIFGLAALISGWWFWRNQVLYDDPTGMSKVNEMWAGREAFENLWAISHSLPYLWSSLWGRFGYGQIPMPQPVYQGLLGVCGLAVSGYLIPRRGRLHVPTMVLLLSTFLTFAVVVCYYILIQPAGAMGRFLFPALSALAILVIAGFDRFFPDRSTWTLAVNLVVSVAMASLAAYALVSVLTPAFAPPQPLPPSALGALSHQIDIAFTDSTGTQQNGVARLLGYQIMPRTARPGDTVSVTLYWQTLDRTEQNYVVFVHLLSDVGTMVTQRDTHPGLGRYPTSTWTPGVVFADTYRLHVPETAYTPDTGYIQIGLYLSGGPRLTTVDGRDAVRLAALDIQPRSASVPNAMDVTFGYQAKLVGYTLDRRVAHPGETIRLTLYWQALTRMEEDYRIFAHILGIENQVWANTDSLPVIPTSQWQPNQIIQDVRDLALGMSTPPDFYDIEIGMYIPNDGRLPVIAEDDVQLGKRLLLSKIRVVIDE